MALVPRGHRRGFGPIVDTWWQTETGAIMISPLPGITATKPGSAMAPLPGISAKIVDDEATPLGAGGNGYLVLDQPWPAMLRGIWGDEQRYRETYWSRYAEQGWYFAGDGARYDDDGALWVLGRVDDVMNVSGHRISTSEVESALVSHPSIAEAAVVGAADETTGQGIVAFVILREHVENTGDTLIKELRDHVAVEISPSPSPVRSPLCRNCRRPGRARSCAACCATSPRAASSATPRRSSIRPSSTRSAASSRTTKAPSGSDPEGAFRGRYDYTSSSDRSRVSLTTSSATKVVAAAISR